MTDTQTYGQSTTVDATRLRRALELAEDELLDIIDDDKKNGTITALSYIDFVVEWRDDVVCIKSFNREFNGDPCQSSQLGSVRLEDGREIPVIYVACDLGIVTGSMALGPVFTLFGRRGVA